MVTLNIGWSMRASAAEPGTFFRGLNLNGPAVVIDGLKWDGQDAAYYTAKADAFENQAVALTPSTDSERAKMIRSSRWGDVEITLRDLPTGRYSVFVYVWEDNDSESYKITLNGREVLKNYSSGSAGHWQRLGPWQTSAKNGRIVIATRGGAANVSGIELWQGDASIRPQAPPPTTEEVAFFEKRIRPLLVKHCYDCHSVGADTAEGELYLDSQPGMLKGGYGGSVLVPGDPDASLLLKAVRYSDDKLQMPPEGKLSDEELADLEAWVRMGAPDPRNTDAAEIKRKLVLKEAADFWSLRPVSDPAAPSVQNSDWPQNDIDRFILAKLEEKDLTPVATADRRTLIRRATVDLVGLPPTPSEVDAFKDDPSPTPEAFSKVVDRLLESRHYGERWGRHWMDLVRYADTAGDNSDYPIPQAYLYRNYIIDSFNDDKPYNEFVREQIAGDLLPGANENERNERTIASGYIAQSRRFGSLAEKYPQHLTIEDTLDNLGRTFLGLTVSCSRCHHHKFDPISQEDYYGLYGIFDSTRYPFPGIELDKKPKDFVPLAKTESFDGGLAYAMSESDPHDAQIHRRGEPTDLGDSVPRKFLDILGGQRLPEDATDESGRRQLAGWIADPKNPLTARVMVNRIWQYHFGIGLVKTPSDFGTRGEPPTHPELLDWLASRFVDSGWSIKQMHRLIMQSRSYQLASVDDDDHLAVDPNNDWHWKFTRRRLDAESLRDAMLAISGNLDASMMREPHPFPPVDKWEFTQHHPFKDDYPSNHRSVYLMTRRLTAKPYFMTFDGPDRNATTPLRNESVTASQALYLLNDEFMHEQASGFAERLLEQRSNDSDRIEFAFQLTIGRPPISEERELALRLIDDVRQIARESESDERAADRVAWESFTRTLFRTNELLYID